MAQHDVNALYKLLSDLAKDVASMKGDIAYLKSVVSGNEALFLKDQTPPS